VSLVVEVSTVDDTDVLQALEAIYERRYHRFVRVAEAVVGDPELARDVVQDAFARLVQRQADFRGEGSLDGWAWRTVVNTALNARRDRPPAPVELVESLESSVNGHPSDARVRALVASLPDRQRLVLFLRYYADLDYSSIGETLQIETGTVGATLNQAHAAIRRLLEEVPR
jgi:RNA polymerase sigma factor (sigma-70 family)